MSCSSDWHFSIGHNQTLQLTGARTERQYQEASCRLHSSKNAKPKQAHSCYLTLKHSMLLPNHSTSTPNILARKKLMIGQWSYPDLAQTTSPSTPPNNDPIPSSLHTHPEPMLLCVGQKLANAIQNTYILQVFNHSGGAFDALLSTAGEGILNPLAAVEYAQGLWRYQSVSYQIETLQPQNPKNLKPQSLHPEPKTPTPKSQPPNPQTGATLGLPCLFHPPLPSFGPRPREFQIAPGQWVGSFSRTGSRRDPKYI